MVAKAKHLIFYDGACGFCDHAVLFLIRQDVSEQFVFAPLQGPTAQTLLKAFPQAVKNTDTLILLENYQSEHPKVFILGKGTLRICWLLGGLWAVPGVLSYLPSWCVDWAYKIVARNRNRFGLKKCALPTDELRDRFLK